MRRLLVFVFVSSLLVTFARESLATDAFGDGRLTASAVVGGHTLVQDRPDGGTAKSGFWIVSDSSARVGLGVRGEMFFLEGPIGLDLGYEVFTRHRPQVPAAAAFSVRADQRQDASVVARVPVDGSTWLMLQVGYGHRSAFLWRSKAGGISLEYRLALHCVTVAAGVRASPIDGLGVEARLLTSVVVAGADPGPGELGLEVGVRIRVHERLIVTIGGTMRTESAVASSDVGESMPAVSVATTTAVARLGAGLAF